LQSARVGGGVYKGVSMSLLKKALGNYGIFAADQKRREFDDLLASFDDRTLAAFCDRAMDGAAYANDAYKRGERSYATDPTIMRTAFDALVLAVIAEMERRDAGVDV
jgi:hypothetical protein